VEDTCNCFRDSNRSPPYITCVVSDIQSQSVFNSDMNFGGPPLLSFSETQERASILNYSEDEDYSDSSMPPGRRRRRTRSTVAKGRRRRVARGKVRVVKGRVRVHVPGYKGNQSFSSASIVSQLSKATVKAAARKLVQRTGVKKQSRRRRRRRVGVRRTGRRKRTVGRRRRRAPGKTRRRRRRRQIRI